MSTKVKETNYDMESVTGIKLLLQIGNFFVVQIRKIFKTPFMLFGIFGIPLILLFGMGALIPSQNLLTPAFGLEAVIVSGIVFGDLYYNIENSSMKNNTHIFNYGHKTKIFTISLATFIITLIAIVFELFVFIWFENNGLFFMDQFVFFGDKHFQSLSLDLSYIPWLNLFYFVILNIILTISFFCFVRIFFKTNKGFIMFLLVYVLLEIIFGGILISTFNAVDVEIINNKIYSTGTIESRDSIINNILNNEQNSLLELDGFYSLIKFITPNFFLNQQLDSLFRVGSYQSDYAYYWSIDNSLIINWNVMFDENGDLIKGYQWMADMQNYLLYGFDSNGNAVAGQILNNEEYLQYLSIHSLNTEGTTLAMSKYVYALPTNISYWNSTYNNPTLLTTIIFPWMYIVVLSIMGYKI